MQELIYWSMAVGALLFWLYSVPMLFEVRKNSDGIAPALVLSGFWIFSKQRFNEESWDRFFVGRMLYGATVLLGTIWAILYAF